MKNTFNLNHLAVAFILSSGLAFSAYLLSLTIYRAQVANDTVSVKGLAEKEIQADWAQVDVYFTREDLLSKSMMDWGTIKSLPNFIKNRSRS